MDLEPGWVEALQERLLTWYASAGRDLPWRRRREPYAIWISEIMLQQTQVAAVIPYYERWMARFPTVEHLAAAPLDEVLKLWEGLGYYARARNLHRAAQQVVNQHDGRLPDDPAGLLALPGIGRYTAGAIASIAFGRRAAALDGNLKRVLARLVALEAPINRPEGERPLWAIAAALLPPTGAGDWNQALMDLGATICIPRQPRCTLCPLSTLCRARAAGREEEIPVRVARRPRPHHTESAALLRHPGHGALLLLRRPEEALLGGLWRFPGTRCRPGETPPDSLTRFFQSEYALGVETGSPIGTVNHGYTHFTVTLHVFEVLPAPDAILPQATDTRHWVSPDALATYALGGVDRQVRDLITDPPP